MKMIRVYINSKVSGSREIVKAEVIRENSASFIVRLVDGNIIKRKKGRDIPPKEKDD